MQQQQPMYMMNTPAQPQTIQMGQFIVMQSEQYPVQSMPQYTIFNQQSQAMPLNSFVQTHQVLQPPAHKVGHPPQLAQSPHVIQSSQGIQQSRDMPQSRGHQADITMEPNPTYQASVSVNSNMTVKVQDEYEYLTILPEVNDQPITNADHPPPYAESDEYI